MHKPALVSLIVVVCLNAATTYYVSNNGDDSREGTSETSALKTLNQAAQEAVSGDMVLLRRGDVFRESADFKKSDLTFDAYGDDGKPLPVVSGSDPVTNWTLHEGSIYKASYNGPAGYLYVNGKLMRIARYPNTGWLRTKSWTENSDGTNTVITTESLVNHPRNTSGYWVGANIRWHRHSWWFETRKITSYDAAGQISLDQKSLIPIKPYNMDGWGFYLDNKLEELDSPGEFFYDSTGQTLYLWAPDNADPNELLIEISSRENGVSVTSATVKNIRFAYQRDIGLKVGNASIIESCLFEGIGSDQGGTALKGNWNTAGSEIRGCTFRNNLNVGIGWNQNPSATPVTVMENNTLINTGMVDGYGGSGSWHADAIIIYNGTGIKVQKNVIEGSGYAAIILGSDGNFAEYNIIRNAMATLNDGGAIYTNCNNSTIRHNLIYDTKGGMESSGPWANLAHGIWPEFLDDFRDNVIENNTCTGSGGFGIFLPNNFSSTVRGNVLYNNGRAAIELSGKETNSSTGRTENLPQNNLIENNVFYAAEKSQAAILFRPQYDYGTMSGNYFCNAYRDSSIKYYGTGNKKWSQYWTDINDWQNTYSWADDNPKTDIIRITSELPGELRGQSKLLINDTYERKAVAVGDNGVYLTLDGDTVRNSFELDPFSSAVIVHTGLTHSKTAIARENRSTIFSASLSSSGREIRVRLSLPDRSSPSVLVYDIRGRLVRKIGMENLGSGQHNLLLKMKNALASGFYHFSLENSGKTFPLGSSIVIGK